MYFFNMKALILAPLASCNGFFLPISHSFEAVNIPDSVMSPPAISRVMNKETYANPHRNKAFDRLDPSLLLAANAV